MIRHVYVLGIVFDRAQYLMERNSKIYTQQIKNEKQIKINRSAVVRKSASARTHHLVKVFITVCLIFRGREGLDNVGKGKGHIYLQNQWTVLYSALARGISIMCVFYCGCLVKIKSRTWRKCHVVRIVQGTNHVRSMIPPQTVSRGDCRGLK